ncbi:MAG TPA: Eco57I restriction-modification methylase domain-containing protein [Prolixibacteraceae bacterium]|nr:Eco57I restriction-modification methylase domain-containing protein [Prolixibacteraceae bacterium]
MIELKEKYKTPSEFADFIGLEYACSTSDKHKKDNGQFFTPKQIADFMGNLASSKSNIISILDPGCGTGILTCSLIEKLIQKSDITKIELSLFETDENVLSVTQKVIDFLASWLAERNIQLKYQINRTDFVIENSKVFNISTLFGFEKVNQFDYIISNPPYFKISKTDKRAIAAKELVYGQPNIYSLFMGVAAKLLKQDGELIFITPRSFAAGNYFKAFRQSFFNDVSISNIHIFESRNKMFKNDNVLQENIILRATKQSNAEIKITVSECDKGLNNPTEKVFKTNSLIDLKSKDKVLFIPSNDKETNTIEIFKKWQNTLNDFNIQISTGPVVAFRCTEFLKSEGTINGLLSPLIWLHNIKEMEFIYPLQKGNKPSLIVNSEESRKVLLKNKNYILLRRFSSKDDKSRLVCCPFFSSNFETEMVGFENHLNYIHRPNGDLSENEIWGISALYSSSLFDTYFRTFNGNTQVGATELKQIKMPPLDDIILIGSKIKEFNNPEKQDIDTIVNEVLLDKPYVKNTRSTGNFARVGVA